MIGLVSITLAYTDIEILFLILMKVITIQFAMLYFIKMFVYSLLGIKWTMIRE